jgi:hypothetical protein
LRIVKNSGTDRVIDVLRTALAPGARLDIATPEFSLFAFGELRGLMERAAQCRLLLPAAGDLRLLGGDADRAARNQLHTRWLARTCLEWLERLADVRDAGAFLPQAAYVVDGPSTESRRALTGACAFTTDGLGLTPGQQFGLVQCAESSDEVAMLGSWFSGIWDRLPATSAAKASLADRLRPLASHTVPAAIYHLVLYHLFKDLGDTLDEERIVRSATGIRDTAVWRKLYRFQRDGVVGAIDKLERLGGCIIADSVGLGKTFEALAVIKYYELRNDRVLVLCPKRLRDNWTLYKANDRRNVLAADRLHYDVLNHTDLSRGGGGGSGGEARGARGGEPVRAGWHACSQGRVRGRERLRGRGLACRAARQRTLRTIACRCRSTSARCWRGRSWSGSAWSSRPGGTPRPCCTRSVPSPTTSTISAAGTCSSASRSATGDRCCRRWGSSRVIWTRSRRRSCGWDIESRPPTTRWWSRT